MNVIADPLPALPSPEGDWPRPARLRIALRGGTMAGWSAGPEGRPVDLVFVHANGFNAATYAPLLAPLTRDFRVVALDLRGHGRSELPAEAGRLTNWHIYADDLADALDRLVENGRRVVLAGHSLGGIASVLAAAKRPEKVGALALLDPVLLSPWINRLASFALTRGLLRRFPLAVAAEKRRSRFPDREAVIDAYRPRRTFAGWQKGFLEGYVADGFIEDGREVRLACRPEWEAATFRAQGHDAWGSLRALQVPVSVAMATQGSTVHGDVDAVLRARKDAVCEVIGRSHFFPMEEPDATRAFIRRALADS